MAKKEKAYSVGENPASLQNLRPRQPLYEESKRQRAIVLTDTGWEGFKELAQELGLSASELVEQLGRGLINVTGHKQHKK